MFGVNISRLRFYEKEFPTLKPKKNRSGDRVYTPDEVKHLREIFELVEEKGFKLQGAREHLKNRSSAQTETAKLVAKLQELKGFLIKLRDEMP